MHRCITLRFCAEQDGAWSKLTFLLVLIRRVWERRGQGQGQRQGEGEGEDQGEGEGQGEGGKREEKEEEEGEQGETLPCSPCDCRALGSAQLRGGRQGWSTGGNILCDQGGFRGTVGRRTNAGASQRHGRRGARDPSPRSCLQRPGSTRGDAEAAAGLSPPYDNRSFLLPLRERGTPATAAAAAALTVTLKR